MQSTLNTRVHDVGGLHFRHVVGKRAGGSSMPDDRPFNSRARPPADPAIPHQAFAKRVASVRSRRPLLFRAISPEARHDAPRQTPRTWPGNVHRWEAAGPSRGGGGTV